MVPDGDAVNLFWIVENDRFPCLFEGSCDISEDGTVQTVGFITWSDGTNDTVLFQATPEPSSMIALGTVLALIGLGARRRNLNRRTAVAAG